MSALAQCSPFVERAVALYPTLVQALKEAEENANR
jgi:hypothetical protein